MLRMLRSKSLRADRKGARMSEAAVRAIEALNAVCRRQREPESGIASRNSISDEARRFHGQSHANLFPFIGRKVRTPGGPGTLLQVFADRATVVLDSQVSQCAVFEPSEIQPVSVECDA